MPSRPWVAKLTGVFVSVLAVGTVSVAGCMLWELQFAERFGHEAPTWIPLSGVYGGKAHSIVKALDTDPAVDLGPAKTFSEAQLRLSPANHYAWLRLAFIDVVETGNLSPRGVAFLQRSYDVAPYDALTWRISMAFETWPSLPPDLKAAVIDELKVNWRTGRRRRLYSGLPKAVHNVQGLAALNAVLEELQADDRARYRQEKLLKDSKL